MSWQPDPLPELPPGFDDVVEQLAERIHHAWARERLDQGWVFGPKRDDDRKQHPSLIPYEELSEEEKDLDRVVAARSVALMAELGLLRPR